jgi:hypothetical protein
MRLAVIKTLRENIDGQELEERGGRGGSEEKRCVS